MQIYLFIYGALYQWDSCGESGVTLNIAQIERKCVFNLKNKKKNLRNWELSCWKIVFINFYLKKINLIIQAWVMKKVVLVKNFSKYYN